MGASMTRRTLSGLAASFLVVCTASAQDVVVPARLGILLDRSAEMGFIVPQVLKELRVLNQQLGKAGRPPVILREMSGSSLEREGLSSLGATKNAFYALRDLYAEVDTVLWITALKGQHSSEGIDAVEAMIKEPVPGRPPRRLVLRNVWPDQIIAGEEWVRSAPEPEDDPLDLRNRPEEWYRLLAEGRGNILRSWQVPPPSLRAIFGFPPKVVSSLYLKKLGYEGREAAFDPGWALSLEQAHGLKFQTAEESWRTRLTGRRWITEVTMLPFPNEEDLASRNEIVLGEMTSRDSIEEDLARIEAERFAVVFALGYLKSDMDRALANRGKEPRGWRDQYLADLLRVGAECRRHEEEQGDATGRVYEHVRIEAVTRAARPESPDPVTRAIARLAREDKVPAVYLFTNAWLGSGDYGGWPLDLPMLALAIRETGTKLYVRVPFEFGPVPSGLTRLALASGGGVLQGKTGDPDWEMDLPSPRWP